MHYLLRYMYSPTLTCPPLSIARYSFIQLSEQGRQWRERKCPIFETVTKRDSNPGSPDCDSDILPLSYRATRNTSSLCYWKEFGRPKQCVAILISIGDAPFVHCEFFSSKWCIVLQVARTNQRSWQYALWLAVGGSSVLSSSPPT